MLKFCPASAYSTRTRSSADYRHISGTERSALATELPQLTSVMISRTPHHGKGRPDITHITADKIEESTISTTPALALFLRSNFSPGDAHRSIAQRLHAADIQTVDIVAEMACSLTGLYGAALTDSSSGERLDPDPARGVRVPTFNTIPHPDEDHAKDHFHEALVLASEVHNASGIVVEICLSDDPFCTCGYFVLDGLLRRTPNIKDYDSTLDIRIFIVKPNTDVPELTDYLGNTSIHIKPPPDVSPPTDTAGLSSDLSAIVA